MTKTQEIGMELFPWKKVLTELTLQKNVGYTITELIKLAQHWGTCPCGAQDICIERLDGGKPKDVVLSYLGIKFPNYVIFQDWYGALNIFNRIEHRARELMREKKIKEGEAYRNPYEGLRYANTVTVVDHVSMMRSNATENSPILNSSEIMMIITKEAEIEEQSIQEAEVVEDLVLETEVVM